MEGVETVAFPAGQKKWMDSLKASLALEKPKLRAQRDQDSNGLDWCVSFQVTGDMIAIYNFPIQLLISSQWEKKEEGRTLQTPYILT